MGEGQEEVGLVGGTHQAGQTLRDAARGMVSEACFGGGNSACVQAGRMRGEAGAKVWHGD